MKNIFDEKTGYCRTLGHHVPFKYCRSVNDGIPCRKIKDCWFEHIEIEQFIFDNYTESERERIFILPPPKIVTLIDLINKARKNI